MGFKESGEMVIGLLEKFIGIFLSDAVSTNAQQLVRVLVLIVLFLLFCFVSNFFFRLIKDVVNPLIKNLAGDVQYLFFSFIALLIFVFCDPIPFAGACFALVVLMCISQIYPIVNISLKFAEKKRETTETPKDDLN